MTIKVIRDMICVLLNVRLGLIWTLEMRLHGFI